MFFVIFLIYSLEGSFTRACSAVLLRKRYKNFPGGNAPSPEELLRAGGKQHRKKVQSVKEHMRLNRTADVLGVVIKELQVEKHRNTIMEINITSEIPDCKSLQGKVKKFFLTRDTSAEKLPEEFQGAASGLHFEVLNQT